MILGYFFTGLDHFIKSLHAWRRRSGKDYGPLALAYTGVMGNRATRYERAMTPRDGMIATSGGKWRTLGWLLCRERNSYCWT